MDQIFFGIIGLLAGSILIAFSKKFSRSLLDFYGWHGKNDIFGMNFLTIVCGISAIIFGLILLLDWFKLIKMN